MMIALVGAGCATVKTTFREETIDTDGGSTSTTYKAVSLAPPLGKLDTTSHEWIYKYGGDENVIATGQNAAGIDNTGQAVLIPLFEVMMNAIADAYKASANVAAPPLADSVR